MKFFLQLGTKALLFFLLLFFSLQGFTFDFTWIEQGKPIPKELIDTLLQTKKIGFIERQLGLDTCDLRDQDFKEYNSEEVYAEAEKFLLDEEYCEAARSFYLLSDDVLPNNRQAYLRSLVSLVLGGLYLESSNLANEYISRFPSAKNEETARFLLLLSEYHRASRSGVKLSQLKTSDFLGLNADQVPERDLSYNRSVRSYLEKYPQGSYNQILLKMRDQLRDQLCRHEIEIAKYRIKRGDYIAAITVLDPVLKNYGVGVSALPEAMFLEVKAQKLFSLAVLDPNEIEDSMIWMWLRADPGSAIDRQQISQVALQSATDFAKGLQEKFPDDPFTQQALELLGKDTLEGKKDFFDELLELF